MSRAQFLGGAQIRVRWASIVLDDASLALPSILSGVPAFKGWSEERFRAEWQRRPPVPRAEPWRPRLLTLARSDVAGLRISNVGLQACRFVGAHNLDKLRLEGSPLFALPPTGWTWRRLGGEGLPIWRWTPRLTLAEEQRWRRDRPDLRDTPAGRPHPQCKGWYPPECRAAELFEEPIVVPVQLASLYGELRKGREDAEDEHPVRKVPAPKPEVDPDEVFGQAARRALTPEEAGQLLARFPPAWWDHVITLLGTGLRFGEFAGLRRRRVQFEREVPVLQVAPIRYQAASSAAASRAAPRAQPRSDPSRLHRRS